MEKGASTLSRAGRARAEGAKAWQRARDSTSCTARRLRFTMPSCASRTATAFRKLSSMVWRCAPIARARHRKLVGWRDFRLGRTAPGFAGNRSVFRPVGRIFENSRAACRAGPGRRHRHCRGLAAMTAETVDHRNVPTWDIWQRRFCDHPADPGSPSFGAHSTCSHWNNHEAIRRIAPLGELPRGLSGMKPANESEQSPVALGQTPNVEVRPVRFHVHHVVNRQRQTPGVKFNCQLTTRSPPD